MAPMKRSAGSVLASERKRMRTGSCNIAKALKHADLPKDTKKMMSQAIKLSLSAFADERHEYQKNVIQMAQETLGNIETRLKAAVAAAKEKVGSMDHERLQAAIPEQAHARAQVKSDAANREADVVEAKMKCGKAEESLKVALKEQQDGDVEHSEIADKKAELTTLFSRVEVMKTCKSTKAEISKLQALLSYVGLDESVVDSIREVFSKVPEERGDFDSLTLNHLDTAMATRTKEVDAKLAELEPGRLSREAKSTAAKTLHDGAKAQLDAAKAALKAAGDAVNDSEASLSDAHGVLKNFGKHLKAAQDAEKDAENKLAQFQSGILQSFKELAERSKPSPVPEPEEQPEEQPEGEVQTQA